VFPWKYIALTNVLSFR